LVDARFDPEALRGEIVLQPNRSWSWRANLYLLGTLALASGIVPLALTTQGYWLVLPFSVAELAAVFGAVYVCVRRTHRQEVIRLSPTELVVETGHRRCEQLHRYDRFHTRVLVHPPRYRWDRSRVAVRCRDQEIEVGSFLTQPERRALVKRMRDMIEHLNAQPATHTRSGQWTADRQ
jgi:uncharacterized membrane protein